VGRCVDAQGMGRPIVEERSKGHASCCPLWRLSSWAYGSSGGLMGMARGQAAGWLENLSDEQGRAGSIAE
jgi:hypothetical protein